MLAATVRNPGPAGKFTLRWQFVSPSGVRSQFAGSLRDISAGATAEIQLPYTLVEPCPRSYTEYQGQLTLVDAAGKPLGCSEIRFGTWTTPIDLELGAAYLRPDQKQFVRMNLGLSAASMARVARVRLELLRRGTGAVLGRRDIPATLEAIQRQREKIPADLREDFANLLLANFDVGNLPVQPFSDPQRNWVLRATVLDTAGKAVATVDSVPFCRLGRDAPQAPVRKVHIDITPGSKCLDAVLGKATALGPLPNRGDWVRLEAPLDAIGAAGKLLDGVGFLHEGGRVEWGRTSIIGPAGKERIVWGDMLGLPPELLAQVKISVAGLKAGTRIRVAFEDRELVAENGYFTDDFRGHDLYERFGGGPYAGYGDSPVALHVYELPAP